MPTIIIDLPRGVITRDNKDGTRRYYLRLTWREDGKQRVRYILLPDPSALNFHSALAKARAQAGEPAPAPATRDAPAEGTISALIRAFRPTLQNRKGKKGEKLSASSLASWHLYLRQIDAEHGHKKLVNLHKKHIYKIRDDMAATPGKSNAYMSRLRVLLEFACRRGLMDSNPAVGMEDSRAKTKPYRPWPGHVIGEVLDKASEPLRMAITSCLFSGQRISDVLRMRKAWIQDGVMVVPGSQKTDTPAYIPMCLEWVEEIDKAQAVAAERGVLPIALVHLNNGQPYRNGCDLRKELRKILRKLGHVVRDEQDRPLDKFRNVAVPGGLKPKTLYNFHGLSKNAICALTEAGFDETTISAIVGKTVEMVRYYGKDTRKWMLVKAAAEKVVTGDFGRLVGRESRQ